MGRALRVAPALLAAAVTVAAARSPAAAQATGEQVQPPRPEHEIKRLWRDLDQLKFEVEQIYIYNRYCLPPDGPNIADTQWEIDFAAHLLKFLQLDFDRLESSFNQAGNSSIGNSYRGSFPPFDGTPPDHRDYWPRARAMLSDVAGRIKAKQDALDPKKEVNCGAVSRQPAAPPPPPPVDWLKDLSRPVPAAVTFAELKPEFCSQTDKHEWIKANIAPSRQAANDNARAAADYRVDVGRRMRDLEAKDIAGTMTQAERAGWRKLIDEYQWASDNLVDQDKIVRQMDQHYSSALAIPVKDCSTDPPQSRVNADPVSQPRYEMYVFPRIPDRFCSQAEKAEAESQFTAARDAARRNSDRAAAKVIELGDRIAAGDQSTELSAGFREANDAYVTWLRQSRNLDAALRKAEAMPVVDCGPEPATKEVGMATPVNPADIVVALRDPGSQMMLGEVKAGGTLPGSPDRQEELFDLLHEAGSGPAASLEAAPSQPSAEVEMYFLALGGSSGPVAQLFAVNRSGEPVRVPAGPMVLEPVLISPEAQARIGALLQRLIDAGQSPQVINAYCLEFLRQPPAAGMVLRMAGRPVQERFARHTRLLDAAGKLRDLARFTPDGDPESYFHAIRQWAIWTVEERLDARRFVDAFVKTARRNYETAGDRWTGALERAVRALVPNRWKDVQAVLGEAGLP